MKLAETSAAVIAWHAGNHARILQERYGLSLRKIEEVTGISKSHLHRYALVSRRRDSVSAIKAGESISSIIEEDVLSKREQKARAAAFDKTDAEHAMKLRRLATRNDNPNEAAVAKKKLDQFASDLAL